MANLPERSRYHALILTLLGSVCGAFLTADLFNLYVWFEVMLLSSFVLLSTGVKQQGLGGAYKYVLLNLISSLVFLIGVGLLYGRIGALNYAHLAHRFELIDATSLPLLTVPMFLLVCAFAIKASLAPFYFWLPASYHFAPATISALFSALLTKVGVYALIRLFSILPLDGFPALLPLLIGLAIASMVLGVIGALGQDILRRLLAFHIVSQVGYMVLGFAVGGRVALAGAIFYLVHHIIAKANLFFIAGILEHSTGHTRISRQGGMWKRSLLVSFAFMCAAGSLAGIPPFSGFFAKFFVIMGSFEVGAIAGASVALVVGLGTLFSMVKVWENSFWKKQPEERTATVGLSASMVGVVVALGVLSLSLGLACGPLYALADKIAGELLNPGEARSLLLPSDSGGGGTLL